MAKYRVHRFVVVRIPFEIEAESSMDAIYKLDTKNPYAYDSFQTHLDAENMDEFDGAAVDVWDDKTNAWSDDTSEYFTENNINDYYEKKSNEVAQ